MLNQVTHANATKTTYGYDPLDRVNSIEHRKVAGETLLAKFEYELGPTGRREVVHEEIDDGTPHESDVTYGYDDLDRLISEERTGWPETYTLGFVYDAVGNRKIQTRTSSPDIYYDYDVRDRLTCENDDEGCETPTVAYTWDASGRMTERGTELFEWDPEDRLLEHRATSTAAPTTFAYDMDGIRYRKQTGSDPATEYLVDANRQYQEVLEEWTAGSPDTLAMEYALGPSLLWQRDGAGEQRWFHGDAQMSTRILTTTTATVASKLAYEAFGSDVAPPSTMPTSYRYTGQQADSATQGYYLRARYMSPGTGQFATEDPFDGMMRLPLSLHRFLYGNLQPAQFVDPTGRLALKDGVDKIGSKLLLFLVLGALGTDAPIFVRLDFIRVQPNPNHDGWSEVDLLLQLAQAKRIWAEANIELDWTTMSEYRRFNRSLYDVLDEFKARRWPRMPVICIDESPETENKETTGLGVPGVGAIIALCQQGICNQPEENLLAHELGHAIGGLVNEPLNLPDRLMSTHLGPSLSRTEKRDAWLYAKKLW